MILNDDKNFNKTFLNTFPAYKVFCILYMLRFFERSWP